MQMKHENVHNTFWSTSAGFCETFLSIVSSEAKGILPLIDHRLISHDTKISILSTHSVCALLP